MLFFFVWLILMINLHLLQFRCPFTDISHENMKQFSFCGCYLEFNWLLCNLHICFVRLLCLTCDKVQISFYFKWMPIAFSESSIIILWHYVHCFISKAQYDWLKVCHMTLELKVHQSMKHATIKSAIPTFWNYFGCHQNSWLPTMITV